MFDSVSLYSPMDYIVNLSYKPELHGLSCFICYSINIHLLGLYLKTKDSLPQIDVFSCTAHCIFSLFFQVYFSVLTGRKTIRDIPCMTFLIHC